MSSIDLSRFNFSGGENSAPIEDLTRLPQEDQQRLVLAGIDVHDTKVSGAFMQLNHADVHCTTRQEGLDLMDIRAALKKFDGLPQYYWKLLDPNKDEITRMAYEHLNGGYFVRARKGVKISQPVQSCMFIKGNAAGQAVHNIVEVEEGAELNILGGCATSQHSNDAAHLGITEYYVEKGGKLTFAMIHNWGDSTTVRPRSAGVVEAGGVFQNNYILLKSVGSLQSYPRIDLNGGRRGHLQLGHRDAHGLLRGQRQRHPPQRAPHPRRDHLPHPDHRRHHHQPRFHRRFGHPGQGPSGMQGPHRGRRPRASPNWTAAATAWNSPTKPPWARSPRKRSNTSWPAAWTRTKPPPPSCAASSTWTSWACPRP